METDKAHEALYRSAILGWAGHWFCEGARIAPRLAVATTEVAVPAMKSNIVTVRPSVTQLLANAVFSGGAPGSVGHSGNTGIAPLSWVNFTTILPKDIVACGAGALHWRSRANSGNSFGGWRSASLIAPSDAVMISFTAEFFGVPIGRECTLIFAWHDPVTGVLEDQVGNQWGKAPASSIAGVSRRGYARMNKPAGERGLVIYLAGVSGQTNSDFMPECRISDITLSTTGNDQPPAFQPSHVSSGTAPELDIALRVPVGDYAFVGRLTSGQVISRSVRVSASTAGNVSLLETVGGGSADFDMFTFIPIADFNPADATRLAAPD